MINDIPRNATLTFKHYTKGGERVYVVTGRVAQTLWQLVRYNESGITALEMSNTWALRLADYVHSLRHDYTLEIQTVMQPHDGGKHARYFLRSAVEILELAIPDKQ